MKDDQKYFDCLLEGVERKRKVSVQEFYKTDLNRSTDLESVNKWYLHLTQILERNPPKKFVRGLKIYEDEHGNIKSVEYDYCKAFARDIGEIAFTFFISGSVN